MGTGVRWCKGLFREVQQQILFVSPEFESNFSESGSRLEVCRRGDFQTSGT